LSKTAAPIYSPFIRLYFTFTGGGRRSQERSWRLNWYHFV